VLHCGLIEELVGRLPVRTLAWLPLLLLAGGCTVAPGGTTESAAVPAGPDPALVARHDQAVARLQAGDDAGARVLLLELVRAQPDLGGPLLNLAMVEARAGHEEAALAWLARAARACERCGAVWNELGMIRRRQGRFEEAEAAYQEALRREPGFALARYNLAVLYDLYLQRPGLALAYYEQYLDGQADPDTAVEVQKWVADLRRRTGVPGTAARAEGES
jgi:tetratricopeptide (TPR) repeat protein